MNFMLSTFTGPFKCVLFLSHNLRIDFLLLAFYEHSQCTLFHILFSLHFPLFSFSKHPVTCACAHTHTETSPHTDSYIQTYIHTYTQIYTEIPP